MELLKAFRFEVMPNGLQVRVMKRTAGCCRFIYNQALALQINNYHQITSDFGPVKPKYLSYPEMTKHLTAWKQQPELAWLSQAPSQSLQQALKDLDRAYKNFFEGRASFPKFKKRGSGDSFRFPDPKQIQFDASNARIKLPKLGWLRIRLSRPIQGEIRNVTLSQTAGKWFISIQTRQEVTLPPPKGGMVGLDLGVARFVTLSDGSFVEPLNSFKKHQMRLARYQKRLARKRYKSNNYEKAKLRVQRIHARIRNVRQDFLHKLSTRLANENAIIAVEDLKIRNMSRSASGTKDEPGLKVSQKRGLNRSILDQAWGEFVRQLDYKLRWKGGHLVKVPPQYTSCTCPQCDFVSKENRKTQASFRCVECGYENNADVVGALNILALGQSVLACGEAISLFESEVLIEKATSVKQESVETIYSGHSAG